MGSNGNLLAAAIAIICVIIVWTLGHMVPFFLLMRVVKLLRVPEDEEIMGLDVSHHGGSAYNLGGDEMQKGGLGRQSKSAVADGSVKVALQGDRDVLARLTALETRNTQLEQEVTQLRLIKNAGV